MPRLTKDDWAKGVGAEIAESWGDHLPEQHRERAIRDIARALREVRAEDVSLLRRLAEQEEDASVAVTLDITAYMIRQGKQDLRRAIATIITERLLQGITPRSAREAGEARGLRLLRCQSSSSDGP